VANSERNPVAFFTPPSRPVEGGRRAGRLGWSLLGVALVSGLALTFIPSPYLIEQPGPVFDTLGTAEYEGEDAPLITVDGAETYPTAGSLDLLTVSVQGNEQVRPSWIEVVGSWFSPSRAVVPVEAIYPSGVSNEQVDEQNAVDMQNSQKSAVAAALVHEGYDVPSTVTVSQVSPGGPSEGVLEDGDVVVSVNGEDLTTNGDVDALRAIVAENGSTSPAEVVVERAGQRQTERITPQEVQGTSLLGVGVSVDYAFPFDVTLRLDKVGGPSAGMMFALGIIDKTTPGELNGGERVAGTGTITASGTVGPTPGRRCSWRRARTATRSSATCPTGSTSTRWAPSTTR
jgi:PDZ domain-containing protein